MQGVFDKVNVYLNEYGKKHHYTIIFGTMSGGNILPDWPAASRSGCLLSSLMLFF
jgi:hypothetical protein